MRTYRLLWIVSFLYFSLAQGQDNPTDEYFELTLGQASDNSYTKGEPAQFLATFPANDTISNSILANGFIGFGKVWDRKDLIQKLEANFEIQKNTLVDKEQDVRQYGISYTAQIIKLGALEQPTGVPQSGQKHGLINYGLTTFIKYSHDDIKDKGGAQVGIGLTVNRLRSRKSYDNDKWYFLNTLEKFPKSESWIGSVIQFSHNHNIGLGYIDTERIYLVNLDLQLNAFPLSKILDNCFSQGKLLYVSFDYNSRGIVFGESSEDTRPLRTWSFGSEYEIGDKSSILIAYNSIQGSNLYKGLAYQDYSTLSLKFKFTIDTK